LSPKVGNRANVQIHLSPVCYSQRTKQTLESTKLGSQTSVRVL